jgi:predicted nuclease with TOPRIM domain
MEDLLNKIQSDVQKDKENITNITKFLILEAAKSASAFKKIDSNFESINQRLDAITTEVVLLKKTASETLGGVDHVSGKIDLLTQEVQKIQKVSNYSEEYDNLLKLQTIGIS